ncbi:MAG TPA: monovalent cation/H(+) antiporter subunit G, partial [Thermoanaerobaculia bacterium]|nr:monovalent cation/H(+) antiporter subunit G [Thermoanaerobaculia bacterium]
GGLAVLTLALAGVWRFPDLSTRLHAAAKIGSLGLAALLMGSLATGDAVLVVRSLLIAVFLVLTAPVATYVVARAAHRRGWEGGREGDGDGAGDEDAGEVSRRPGGSGGGPARPR